MADQDIRKQVEQFPAGGVDALFTSYPVLLLQEAQEQLRLARGTKEPWKLPALKYGLVIILCATACEFAAAKAIQEAWQRRGLPGVGRAVSNLMNGSSLRQERNRKLFCELTGIEVTTIKNWQRFVEMTTLRNKLVHDGRTASEEDAISAIAASRELIERIGMWQDDIPI